METAEKKKRDNLHWNVLSLDGYQCNVNAMISPREAGKTTSMMIDKVYAGFKKGMPTVYMVNQPVEIIPELCGSFETEINAFDGCDILTKYPKGGKSQGDVTTVYARFNENEEWRPMVYIMAFSTPETRLKRLKLGRINCIWYDECNVNVTLGEKWPPNIGTKFNTLYTTLARGNYPAQLKFYMTGNYYTRYNPILTYLGVDCSRMELGKTFKTTCSQTVAGQTVQYDVLVQCYALKQELIDYILAHNPGYAFDDTYARYFEGEAIGDIGIPITAEQPQGYGLRYVFKFAANQYLYIYINKTAGFLNKYWLSAKKEPPGKRQDIWSVSLNQLTANTFLAKGFKSLFEHLKMAISRMECSFDSMEAYYMTLELDGVI